VEPLLSTIKTGIDPSARATVGLSEKVPTMLTSIERRSSVAKKPVN